MEKKSMSLKNKLNLVELSKNEMKSVIGGVCWVPRTVRSDCTCACVCGPRTYSTANRSSGSWGMKSGF